MSVPQKIRVTKVFTFDMAHALHGYDGLCKNIHGHTYRLSITLFGTPITDGASPKVGMVLDFSDLKQIVKTEILDRLDHTLVLKADSPHQQIAGLTATFERVIFSDYQPTCENLLLDIVKRIQPHFQSDISLFNARLEETPTSYADWYAEDQV